MTRIITTLAGKNNDSGHIHLDIEMTKEERENNTLHIIMTQYELKTVINKFKEQGESSAMKELTQLHVLENFAPVYATKLTKKKRAEAVASLLFLKENRNGDRKGCECADGRKQQDTIKRITQLHL